MRAITVLSLLALVAGGCKERELFSGLDARFPDASVDGDADSDVDADADEAVDGDGEGDGEGGVPLECGYPAGRYGYEVGRVVEPFAVWTCDAEETTLPRLWCGHGVTILHVVVAWCGICEASTQALLTGPLADLEGEDVELVELLVEDEGHGEVAEQDTCDWWSERFGGLVSPYIPVAGETTSPLWDLAVADVLPLTLLVDGDGVIRMVSSLDTPPDLTDWIRSILAEE